MTLEISQWLKANRLSLNVKKTELIIFRHKKKLLDHSVKFKFNGKRLLPTSSIKYLGVFLNEYLYCNKQLPHVIAKLKGIDIISKLRHSTNFNILKIVYHSSCCITFRLWHHVMWPSKRGKYYQNTSALEPSLKEIYLKKLHDSATEICKNLKIPRFSESVCMHNCLFTNQIKQNEKIAKSFSKLKYCSDNYNYQTISPAKKLLDIPCFGANVYGTESANFHCIID